MIYQKDLARYHEACQMIEYDGIEGYQTCCKRFGTDIANFILIFFLRAQNGTLEHFPTPDKIVPLVNGILERAKLLER